VTCNILASSSSKTVLPLMFMKLTQILLKLEMVNKNPDNTNE